jgi:isocitrate/isopropylmalate dehydrogenase
MRILVLPGDGIGPEIVDVAIDVANAAAADSISSSHSTTTTSAS